MYCTNKLSCNIYIYIYPISRAFTCFECSQVLRTKLSKKISITFCTKNMREHLTFLLNLSSRLWFVWSHYLQVIKQPDYSSTSSLTSKFFLIPLLVLRVSLSIGCRCVSSISPLYSHRKMCFTVGFKLLLCFLFLFLLLRLKTHGKWNVDPVTMEMLRCRLIYKLVVSSCLKATRNWTKALWMTTWSNSILFGVKTWNSTSPSPFLSPFLLSCNKEHFLSF